MHLESLASGLVNVLYITCRQFGFLKLCKIVVQVSPCAFVLFEPSTVEVAFPIFKLYFCHKTALEFYKHLVEKELEIVLYCVF
jgi:hypothetical protein